MSVMMKVTGEPTVSSDTVFLQRVSEDIVLLLLHDSVGIGSWVHFMPNPVVVFSSVLLWPNNMCLDRGNGTC